MSVCMSMADAAKKRLCPVAAIIATTATQTAFCHGPACGAWRWALDGKFRSIVAGLRDDEGKNIPLKKATSTVLARPLSYGMNGYCGLGGAP